MTAESVVPSEHESLTDRADHESPTWDRESANTPVYAVISAVADATGTDSLELPPLHEAIDPDALNTLFTSQPNTTVDRVSFEYAGCEIVVRGSGAVHVQPADAV